MAHIHNLLKQVQDPALRAELEKEINILSSRKKFGLVFEEHKPECTPLYDVPVKIGTTVARNETGKLDETYSVLKIDGDTAVCCRQTDKVVEEIPVANLVAVAKFGAPIYPYLKPIDSVCNAPDSNLWHTLIEADNYHALQLLKYLYAGKVDCIYIDPPYNTGARDWKYNNDYVDSSDSYRHSKWLSMMKKRLELAKDLLNPADSVLIVTIDEKEYLHLGCLLEEIFPNANIQMVSDVIHPSGVARTNQFSRVDEYLFFIAIGEAKPALTADSMLDFEMTGDYGKTAGSSITWRRMIRAGSNSLRQHSENCFYPIFVNTTTDKIDSVGFPPGKGVDRNTVIAPEGCLAVWPIHSNGDEGVWQIGRPKLMEALEKGTARLGKKNRFGAYAMNYLSEGMVREIERGEIIVKGRDENGALILERHSEKLLPAKSVWNKKTHDATQYGSYLINGILGNKRFTYPKSLYSTHDAVSFFVKEKLNALIIDFFAGSGTTLHAVNLLNAEDGGQRRCILVTNNEVSADEATNLKKRGFNPGDEEWENLGIARYVTWPRTVCSIEGHDVNGDPLKGSYLGSDIPMSDGFAANCEYFKLGFLDKKRVSVGMQFREILPLLWLRAGARGKRPEIEGEDIPEMLILPENGFAVLTDEALYSVFAKELAEKEGVETVFFVTNSDSAFREMSDGIKQNDTYQLYKDYLENFMIGARRALQ